MKKDRHHVSAISCVPKDSIAEEHQSTSLAMSESIGLTLATGDSYMREPGPSKIAKVETVRKDLAPFSSNTLYIKAEPLSEETEEIKDNKREDNVNDTHSSLDDSAEEEDSITDPAKIAAIAEATIAAAAVDSPSSVPVFPQGTPSQFANYVQQAVPHTAAAAPSYSLPAPIQYPSQSPMYPSNLYYSGYPSMPGYQPQLRDTYPADWSQPGSMPGGK